LGKPWLAEIGAPGYLSELTDSFLRPWARRRESTARPSEVFIRERKPCVLARWRLFGWKVRFGILLQGSFGNFGTDRENPIIQQVGREGGDLAQGDWQAIK
jgi:hypothetical protein